MFDLHADGERFALAPAAPAPGESTRDTLVFIVNFSRSPADRACGKKLNGPDPKKREGRCVQVLGLHGADPALRLSYLLR